MPRPITMLSWVSIAASFVAMPAAAEELSKDIKIVWSAPSGCPDETAVRASIASLLRDEAPKSRSGAPSFEAVVQQTGDRFDLHARVRSISGEEEKLIHGDSCATVADAFALVVAFAIDPNLAGRLAPTTASSSETRPIEPQAAELPPPVATPAAPSSNTPPVEPLPVSVGIAGPG
jgi:hypothetical protein